MSITVLVTALLPVFFMLLLGYAAGRYHRFSPDQATGFNQLATNFAMPASLFIDMVQINRQLLLQQGVLLVLAPLLLAPLLGVALVLLAVRLPAVLLAPLQLLGQATTSVAVFAVGLTLTAHRLSFSKLVLATALARVTMQSALLLGLLLLFHVHSELARAAVLACSLPVGVLQVLLASRYGTLEKELPSVMLLTTVAMLGTLPAWFGLINWLLPK